MVNYEGKAQVLLTPIGHADAVETALNSPEAALTLSVEAQVLTDAA